VTGAATVGTTLGVTGVTTLGDLLTTGNTTIGNASGDSLTVTAGAVAINNLPSKSTPIDSDTILIRDSAASNALKTSTISSIYYIKFIYSEDIFKSSSGGQIMAISSSAGVAVQQSGSTSDWTYTWTPKTVGNKALIRVSVPFLPQNDATCYVGILESPYSTPSNVISASGVYGDSTAFNTMQTDVLFVSTASTHTFKIIVGSNQSMNITVASNPFGSYFSQTGSSTFQAKVHFELIEFA
jgi:hypothetical protein